MSSNLMADINSFFINPSTAPVTPGTFSQLYLLRRDISTCFGIDPNNGQRLCTQALWPGVMAICAGIDLLGKFLAGNDKIGEVGKRFKKFLTTYFGISQSEAETIYHLRNSLLHSFGLYSEVTDKKTGNVVRVYRFALDKGLGALITDLGSDTYLIDIEILRTGFENAIAGYETQLRAASLQTKFADMFPKHPGITIR
jgi:hypothetical protein